MSKEADELLNLFILMSSNDPLSIQNASIKFNDLSAKPNYALNLLSIVVKNEIDILYRFSAAIQLKNVIDKQWQRNSQLTDNDKQIIKNQILNSAFISDFKTNKFYNLLGDIIAKISRTDWNQKWPNLFNDLFSNEAWLIIYKVCQVQSSRRLSQGIVLFKELALVMSRQIILKWQSFPDIFQSKYFNDSCHSTLLSEIFNTTYELRTMCLFIRNTHLITNEDEEFISIINNISYDICSFFPNFLTCYLDLSSSCSDQFKIYFYKFLKSMVWILLSYQNKVPSKSFTLSKQIENLTVISIFQSNLMKSEKLTLLLMNLLLNTLKNDDKINIKDSIFTVEIINLIRSKFLKKTDEEIENYDNDPESVLESPVQKEDVIILYKIDDTVDELLTVIIKCFSGRNVNVIMEMIQVYFNEIHSMNMSNLESFLHFLGLVIQSCYYVDSTNHKMFAALCNCTAIVENVVNSIMSCKKAKFPNAWENFVIKRCIWLMSKWVVDDPNHDSNSMDRIISSSHWCFKMAQSSVGLIVKLEVAFFIEHIVESLEKMPASFADNQMMHDVFLNPSISTIVSLLDITSSSDIHSLLIEILIKLLKNTNMWSNIELVKTCANSIYNLWNGIKWPSSETVILRDRLLECLSTIVKSCDPTIIQPILSTLSIFINDSMQLIVKPDDKSSKSLNNCSILLDNTLQLWHDIIYNCESSIEGLDNIYSVIIFSDIMDTELDKNQTTLLLEIIQAHFLLKIIGSMNKESFSTLTFATWNYLIKQRWDPKHEEDLCVMRIQLFDLWLLGFQQLSIGSMCSLMEITSYCQFLCERTKELFTSTNEEPSNDQNVCMVNSILTVLARICLFDKSMLKSLLTYLSNDETEMRYLMIGLLNRWLLRIDSQSSCSIQQLFVLSCIQWIPSCFETDPGILSAKLETLINCCIQICSFVPSVTVEQNKEMAKALPIPAERHLQLAYILWNPLSNYTTEIKKLVTSFLAGLNNSVGLENFQNLLKTLDPVVQSQFIQFCTTSN